MASYDEDNATEEDYIKNLIKDIDNLSFPHKQLGAFKSLCAITSSSDLKLIGSLIALGGLQVILRYAKTNKHSQIQIEAAWALNNIITGCKDHLDAVIKAGALPVLCHLLKSNCLQVCEQAVTVVANIVVTDKIYCEQAIDKGLIRTTISMYYLHLNSPIIIRRVSCILRYICQIELCYTLVKKIMPVIRTLIYHLEKDIKLDVLYAITYFTDNKDFPFKLLLKYGILERMISVLVHSDIKILTVALHGIGNCLKDTENLLENALDNNILQHLGDLVIHDSTLVRKSALFCVGELLGNPVSYSHQLSDINAQFMVNVFINLTDEDDDVNKEAIYALLKLSATGSKDYILLLVHMESIQILSDILEYSKCDIIKMILEIILNLIERSEEYFVTITSMVRKNIDFTTLEYLMKHKDTDIQKFANDIYTDLNYESRIV